MICLAHAGISASETYAAACLVSGIFILLYVVMQFPPILRLYRGGELTTSGKFITFSLGVFVALIALFFWAAFYALGVWPLVTGISAQLVYGLWMFARLLLRAN